MKQNRFTKTLAVGAACAFTLGTAFAQDTSTTTSVTSGSTGASTSTTATTSTMDGTGTITTFTPSADFITMRTESNAEPVKYYYTKQTTVVDSEGNPVDLSMLRSDMPVRYTYTKEGDRMVVTKVTLEKPLSYYKKETTTTTTTNP